MEPSRYHKSGTGRLTPRSGKPQDLLLPQPSCIDEGDFEGSQQFHTGVSAQQFAPEDGERAVDLWFEQRYGDGEQAGQAEKPQAAAQPVKTDLQAEMARLGVSSPAELLDLLKGL